MEDYKMTKEEKRVISKIEEEWDNFYDDYSALNSLCDFTFQAAKKYQELMSKSYKAIKAEWNNELVSKELAKLLCTIGVFGWAFDDEGNSLKGDLYGNISYFHTTFMSDLLENAIELNEDGMYEWDFGDPVDLETFDILSGLDEEYDDED